MIAPDIGSAYPKKGLTMDTQFTGPPRFVSDGSAFFDGADGKVTVSAAAGINGLFGTGGTLSFWIFPNSVGEGNWGRVIDSSTGFVVFLDSASGGTCKIEFRHDWSTDGQWITTNRDITFDVWNHVVVTYDGSSTGNNAVIYVNGVSKAVTENQAPVGSIDADDDENLTTVHPTYRTQSRRHGLGAKSDTHQIFKCSCLSLNQGGDLDQFRALGYELMSQEQASAWVSALPQPEEE